MRKWLIVALSVAWLTWELYAANDHDRDTWPLTTIIVTYVPAWVTLPSLVLLTSWVLAHFIKEYRKRGRR